jgi:hypothetical protein
VRALQLTHTELNQQRIRDVHIDRAFYDVFWEGLRASNEISIDKTFAEAIRRIDELTKEANETETWLGGWKWLGPVNSGVLSFFGHCLGYGVYYGLAIWLGSSLR